MRVQALTLAEMLVERQLGMPLHADEAVAVPSFQVGNATPSLRPLLAAHINPDLIHLHVPDFHVLDQLGKQLLAAVVVMQGNSALPSGPPCCSCSMTLASVVGFLFYIWRKIILSLKFALRSSKLLHGRFKIS